MTILSIRIPSLKVASLNTSCDLTQWSDHIGIITFVLSLILSSIFLYKGLHNQVKNLPDTKVAIQAVILKGFTKCRHCFDMLLQPDNITYIMSSWVGYLNYFPVVIFALSQTDVLLLVGL